MLQNSCSIPLLPVILIILINSKIFAYPCANQLKSSQDKYWNSSQTRKSGRNRGLSPQLTKIQEIYFSLHSAFQNEQWTTVAQIDFWRELALCSLGPEFIHPKQQAIGSENPQKILLLKADPNGIWYFILWNKKSLGSFGVSYGIPVQFSNKTREIRGQ